ncbi:hypothetical protein EG68_08694 [Paragonimus skrjabini miyazakii]|uniref:Heat shock protein 70 n=1 Tax=Paragonimus skrjabini miyazakii TaxID=59628 RepID=A0A8S9YG99_9TREM|nr:hypothetical protein EG68_08694 [Paragonimus skrjabini miyazakii]
MSAIGIDLGTTYCCTAIHENGSTRVILNEVDKRVTPSVVAFTDEAIVFGDEAKEQASLSPENTIYDSKRLIGRRFNDPTVMEDRRIWPFQLVDVQGKPRVRVRYAGKMKVLCAEEILSLLIAHLKTSAENYINKEIKQAVITVPANFDITQREATRDAAKLAGLDIVYLLNEPTAAVLAYALELSITEDRNLLVFDLDVTSLSVGLKKHDGSMEVLIKRNSPIPITVTRSDFTTVYPGDTQADFELYEGEDKWAANNRLLDKFTVTNLTKNRFNLVQFEITFSVDRNGILSVIAAEKDRENRHKLTIGRTSGTLSSAERDEIRERMKSFYADEKAKYAQDEQREALLSYAIAIKTKVQQQCSDD